MKHNIKIDADTVLEVLEELKQARQVIYHRTDHPEDYLKGIDDAIEEIEGVIAHEKDLIEENKNVKKYTVYQLPFENSLKYKNFEFSANHGGVHIENYEKVYTGTLEIDTLDTNVILDKLYTICNLDIPEGYQGHSMSISDIVEIERLGTYFCDRCGWKRIA